MRSRRDFTKLAFAALPGAALSPDFARAADKPDSTVNGVTIGLNVPYCFGDHTMSGEAILANCVQLGISGVELRTQPVETFLGLPPELSTARPPKNAPKLPEVKDKAGKLRAWRTSVSLDRVKDFRAMYESAGVLIEIAKVDGIFKMADDEVDYAFALAKALGARAISTEISHEESDLKRLGTFADKHEFMVGYHGHSTTTPEHWEAAFALAKYNGANVDLGHFVAGNNGSPVPFMKKYHDRITHVHVKDRKMNDGPNVTFGEGDTPITEVLRLIRDNKWNIQATIEYVQMMPSSTSGMDQLAKCVRYCRDALA